jgi:hypothetical protein
VRVCARVCVCGPLRVETALTRHTPSRSRCRTVRTLDTPSRTGAPEALDGHGKASPPASATMGSFCCCCCEGGGNLCRTRRGRMGRRSTDIGGGRGGGCWESERALGLETGLPSEEEGCPGGVSLPPAAAARGVMLLLPRLLAKRRGDGREEKREEGDGVLRPTLLELPPPLPPPPPLGVEGGRTAQPVAGEDEERSHTETAGDRIV